MATTTDFTKFGARERIMATELLNAWTKDGLPQDFENDKVAIIMNMSSGNVFLTNSDHQVAMMNGNKLESFYSCPECGHEGFFEELEHEGNSECKRYFNDVKNNQ